MNVFAINPYNQIPNNQYNYNVQVVGIVAIIIFFLFVWIIGFYLDKDMNSSSRGWSYAFRKLKAKHRNVVFVLLALGVISILLYTSTITADWLTKVCVELFFIVLLIYFVIKCQQYRIISGLAEIPCIEHPPVNKEIKKDGDNKPKVSMPKLPVEYYHH
jgi:hypothetical protein